MRVLELVDFVATLLFPGPLQARPFRTAVEPRRDFLLRSADNFCRNSTLSCTRVAQPSVYDVLAAQLLPPTSRTVASILAKLPSKM
jgi:hypothetical protein